MRSWVTPRFLVSCLGTFLAAWANSGSLEAGEVVRQAFVLRGETEYFFHIPAQESSPTRAPILFVPGDAGWCGAAVDMGHMMATLGYEVYGFDVRRYLTGFTTSRGGLTEDEVRRALALAQVMQR